MTRDAVLVANPTAGGGRAAALQPAVLDALRAGGWAVRSVTSRDGADAARIAAEADPDELVVSLGGDGMHALVASGVATSGACLAALPGGRGDDFVRAVGLPRDPVQAALTLSVARERRIGLGEADGRTFLGVLSIGFSARASRLAHSSRVRGRYAYHVAAVRALAGVPPQHFSIGLDGRRFDWEGLELAVGHSGWYGGGLHVCPDAELTDDVLDVTAIAGHKRAFPAVMTGMFDGTHVRRPEVETFRAREVGIDGEGEVWADGDLLCRLPVQARVRPDAVRLLA